MGKKDLEFQNANLAIADYIKKTPAYWQDIQNKLNVELFNNMVRKVAAYKKFLKMQKIRTKTAKSVSELNSIPPIFKQNYFNKFSLVEVAYKGFYKNCGMVMTSTSGSTGQPTFFPRTEKIDWQYSVLAEYFLANGPKENVLVIDCFGMGIWIGGLITYQAFRYAALRGYPVTVATTGINKNEIFHCLKELAPFFGSVILAGYPPFIKDLLDEALSIGINLRKLNIRLLFAAESFTETFRDYVVKKAGVKNLYFDTLNIYGSAELGAMAFETPLCILLRRLALKNKKFYNKLFYNKRLPTLAQYNPNFVRFQATNGEILISADNAVPLFNYKIGDSGGVCSISEMQKMCEESGIDLIAEAKKNKTPFTTLPFVYVYERSDFSTKLYGAIIYPEHIREALLHTKVKAAVTGKFSMFTKQNNNQDQYLEIHVELKPGQKDSKLLKDLCREIVTASLLEKNAEYKNNYTTMPKKVTPVITLWEHGHPLYFKQGVKQKWVIK